MTEAERILYRMWVSGYSAEIAAHATFNPVGYVKDTFDDWDSGPNVWDKYVRKTLIVEGL